MGDPDRQPLKGMVVILETPMETLDMRINDRVDEMVGKGLIEEVRGLLASGCMATDPGMTSTGYREIASYLEGSCSLEEALEKTKIVTRRYARRQVTWFKNQEEDCTLRINGTEELETQRSQILKEWTKINGE